MGLGVYLLADVPRRGWLRSPVSRDRLFKAVVSTTAAFVERQQAPLTGWMSTSVRGNVLGVSLFPCEEDVEFSLEGGRILCSAKTSTAGPGYHAYLVDLLDELERAQGLAWDESIEGSRDETGFRAARDFGLLQASMADWLRYVARHVVEEMKGLSSPILLGMPVGFEPRTTAFAASPTGEWSREWMAEVASAEGTRLFERASEYFGWWDRGLSARNLRNFGLVRCWMDVAWTAPQSSAERVLLESTLACFDGAVRLDPAIGIPAEAGELQRLLAPDAALTEPGASGIGFLRRAMRRSLPGGWTIDLPGYFSAELEEEGSTQVYFFPGRSVRGSSVSLKGPEGAGAADLLRSMTEQPGERPLALESDHLAGKYACQWSTQEQCHVLQATVAKADGFCVVTISFDEETQQPWAESVAATIFAPPPVAKTESR